VSGSALRVLHFSTSDLNGGAALAAYRLHHALADAGHDSELVVRQKLSEAPDVLEVPAFLPPWRARARRLRRALPFRGEELPPAPPAFNLDVEPDIRTSLFYRNPPGDPDVIVLHSITRLLTVREIRRLHEHYRCPLVWALADQAPLTGGCHYAYDCRGYTDSCGRCPQLRSDDPEDRSRTVWRRRFELLRGLPLAFVAPSTPAADWVRASSAFRDHRVEVIPALEDTTVFRPLDRTVARDLLHVPPDALVVLLGAGDLMHFRKGVAEHVPEALRRLPGDLRRRLFVLALGGHGEDLVPFLPVPALALGLLRDEVAIALAFQAANVFVCPTIADAGPLMIPESLLCGTPVVAFDEGYAVDLLAGGGPVGHLCRERSAEELARGIELVLGRGHGDEVRETCRRAALGHAKETVVARHVALYESLAGGR
jgi:glycosyltransferase involved in cell wall biosynthesis